MSLRLISRLCFRASARPSVKLPVSWRGYGSIAQQTSVQLDNASGGLTVGTSSYHPTWLRHNCHCPDCWCNISEQRKIDLAEISTKNVLKSAKVTDDQLDLVWSSGHHGYINLDWLNQREQRSKEDSTTPTVATDLPMVSAVGLLEDKEKLWQWLYNLNEYGVCILTDYGVEKETVQKLAQPMYSILPTIYGKTYEVEALENEFNLSATNKGLNFHMDLDYYEVPPGLQILHFVHFDECVVGGESVLLDMFAMVEELRRKWPHHFNTLARVPVTFQKFKNHEGDVDLVFKAPHINLDSSGKVISLRWNPANEGALIVPDEDVAPYFEAYECLYTLMVNTPSQLSYRVKPGEVLTFNNRRMLHSRNQFTLNGGRRLLQGIYLHIDHFKSVYQVLCKQLGKNVPVRRVFNNNSF